MPVTAAAVQASSFQALTGSLPANATPCTRQEVEGLVTRFEEERRGLLSRADTQEKQASELQRQLGRARANEQQLAGQLQQLQAQVGPHGC